ncbi:hypothetical protein ACWFMI_11105 [Nocardiopsis terrae]
MPRSEHGDEPEAGEEGPEKSGGRRKRIDLSVAQVAGAGVATLTAATAASYLNVYGTVIGTAVMAVLSTSAAPVIQHWITRSSEQAKELADKKAARHAGARSLVRPGAADPEFDGNAIPAADAGLHGPLGDPDAARTTAMPVLGRDLPGQTVAHGFGNPEAPAVVGGPAAPDATELMPAAHESYTGDPDGSGEGPGGERPKRGRRTAVVSAAAVFVLVMLVILAFELFTGRSLTAWTQGQDEPTSPSLLGGNSVTAQVEEEAPEDTGDEPTPTEDVPGTGEPETEAPADPEPTPTPEETGPDAPEETTDPVDPPVDEGTPEEPGGAEAPDPGTGEAPENGAQPEPAPQAPAE